MFAPCAPSLQEFLTWSGSSVTGEANREPVAVQFVGEQFWKLANVSQILPAAQQEAIQVQKDVSEQLQDRIIVCNHSDSKLQYLFYSFMPRSSILMPWPHNKTKYVFCLLLLVVSPVEICAALNSAQMNPIS